jgi:hypothetical protein
MANTYTLIASNVLISDTASISFTSIPATYTDLVLRMTARSSRAVSTQSVTLKFNGDGTTTKYSRTFVRGDAPNVTGGRQTSTSSNGTPYITGTSATANTFNSVELYIPNYAGATNKPSSGFGAPEDNVTLVQFIEVMAGLYTETAAISSIQLTLPAGDFVSGSSFYLYGIKNS